MNTLPMSFLRTALFLLAFLPNLALPADPLQTQLGMNGDVEVDLVKASIDEGVLTAIFAYRNIGSEDANILYKVSEVYFLDKSEGKKYQVLADSDGSWIASPVAHGHIATDYYGSAAPVVISSGGKKLVWFKFPAPPETSKEIDLVVPDALPFERISVRQ